MKSEEERSDVKPPTQPARGTGGVSGRPFVTVHNVTRGTTLMSDGRVANWLWPRLRGLIGHAPLAPGQGLVIVPCVSIHTHFMGFAIDVVYVSRTHEVVGIDTAIAPWRFGRHYRGTRYVVELPPGTAQATGTQVGDRLQAPWE